MLLLFHIGYAFEFLKCYQLWTLLLRSEENLSTPLSPGGGVRGDGYLLPGGNAAVASAVAYRYCNHAVEMLIAPSRSSAGRTTAFKLPLTDLPIYLQFSGPARVVWERLSKRQRMSFSEFLRLQNEGTTTYCGINPECVGLLKPCSTDKDCCGVR